MNRPAWESFSNAVAGAATIALMLVACSAATAKQSSQSASPAGASASGPTVVYTKIFKSSYPEYVQIKVTPNGSCTADIRALDDEASPQACAIGQALAGKIFSLAGQLHNFNGVDLDIHRRIASLGQKTFAYENGAEKHQVSFNYTLDESATQLQNIFEGLTRQEMDSSDLERTMRYDVLGVNDVLIRIESDYANKLLPEPDRMLPMLDQVAADSKYVDLARQKARALAAKIRATS